MKHWKHYTKQKHTCYIIHLHEMSRMADPQRKKVRLVVDRRTLVKREWLIMGMGFPFYGDENFWS